MMEGSSKLGRTSARVTQCEPRLALRRAFCTGCPLLFYTQLSFPEYTVQVVVRKSMGGNAFKQILPQASFPRMPPAIYKAMKATLLPLVEQFYALAVVPPEAPEKPDYGDLDIVVTYPHSDDAVDRVKEAIRATHYLPQEGRGTSNFAIPVDAFDLPADSASDGAFSLSAQDTYIQVDVNVCADRERWERTVFLHSYGDTGLILGVIGRSAGVSLGVNGLKVSIIASPSVAHEPDCTC